MNATPFEVINFTQYCGEGNRMTGVNSNSKKSKSSAKKGGYKQAMTHVTPQRENVTDLTPT